MNIKKILEKHAAYLGGDAHGRRANLRNANLSWADFSEADLSEADLSNANLRGANLRGVNLRWANLSWADFSEANLSWADLREADLSNANLSNANLRGVNLRGANLSWANLREALNFYLLPVQDLRGYSFVHAVNAFDGWRIRAGRRYFSIDKALAHWGSEDYPDKERGADYVCAVKWLQKKIAGEDGA